MPDRNENEDREQGWTPEERSWFSWCDARIVALQFESSCVTAAARGYAHLELEDLVEQRRERQMRVKRPEPPSHWAKFVCDGTNVTRVDEEPDNSSVTMVEEVRRPKSFLKPDHWEKFPPSNYNDPKDVNHS